MAKWIVYENRDQHLTLLYKNIINGDTFMCGQLRADTTANMILDWVLHQEAVQPGDIIKFQDGTVVQVLSELARA